MRERRSVLLRVSKGRRASKEGGDRPRLEPNARSSLVLRVNKLRLSKQTVQSKARMEEAACFQEKLMGGDRLLVVTAGERLALQRICWNWQNKQERSTRDTEPGSTENVGPQGACANDTVLGARHYADCPILRERTLGAQEIASCQICRTANSGSSRRMDRAVTYRRANPALTNILGTSETHRAR